MADRSLEILIQLQANTAAAAQVQGALKDMTQSATLAARALEQAFSPRLVQSQQQLAAQMFQGGKAIANFATEVEFLKGVGVGTTQSLNALSAEMIRLSTAGNITSKTMDELIAKSQAIWAQNNLVAAGLNQVTTGLKAQSVGLETVNAGLGSMTPNATAAQKAGQGLILSFSLSQAMAGNFAQSLFGLGFSLLFVGPQMLNVITIATALGAALGGIAIQKLTDAFKNDAVPILERVAKQMKEIRDSIAEVRGATKEWKLAFDAVADAEGDLDALAGVTLKLTQEQDKLTQSTQNTIEKMIDIDRASPFLIMTAVGRDLNLTLEETAEVFNRIGITSSADIAMVARELALMSAEGSDAAVVVADAMDVITARAANAAAEISSLFAEFNRGIADTAADAARAAPFDAIRSELERNFEIQQEQAQAASQAGNAAASRARQDRTRMLRRALDDELNVHREHIERIKETLSDRVDVIKDATTTEVRLIRERVSEVVLLNRRALQDNLDDMKASADDRIDAVKNAADAELDINKDRIDALKDQERDLVEALKDLTRRRQEGIRDILQAEEEIAELEALQRQQGVDPSIELELALRGARLRALNEEQANLEDQVDVNEDQLRGIEELIEAEEERGEQIKKNRDAAIDAIKDVLAEAQKAARRRSEDDIRAIQRTRDAEIRAANDAADAKIEAEQEAANRRIQSIESIMDRARRANEDLIAGIQAAASASNAADSQRRRNDRDALAKQLEYIQILQDRADKEAEREKFIRDNILPLLRIVAEESVGRPGQIFLDILRQAIELGVPANLFTELFKDIAPFPNLGGAGFATGGTVPGPVGEPMLAVLHGGERVESAMTSKHARGGAQAAGVLKVILEAGGDSVSMSDMKKLKRVLNRSFGRDIEVHLRSRRLIA